jgi:hypothetical protein
MLPQRDRNKPFVYASTPLALQDSAWLAQKTAGENASHMGPHLWETPAVRRWRRKERRIGAGDGDRTRDVQLGKLAFYR